MNAKDLIGYGIVATGPGKPRFVDGFQWEGYDAVTDGDYTLEEAASGSQMISVGFSAAVRLYGYESDTPAESKSYRAMGGYGVNSDDGKEFLLFVNSTSALPDASNAARKFTINHATGTFLVSDLEDLAGCQAAMSMLGGAGLQPNSSVTLAAARAMCAAVGYTNS